MRRRFSANKRHSIEYWMYGLHAVRCALQNTARSKKRLFVTSNVLSKIQGSLSTTAIAYEIVNVQQLNKILPGCVHQGIALLTNTLISDDIEALFNITTGELPRVAVLDKVTDPQNIGSVLRSAWFFGLKAVITSFHDSPAENATIAKSASGALEFIPYIQVKNIGHSLNDIRNYGYSVVGLGHEACCDMEDYEPIRHSALAIVLGAEGKGLSPGAIKACDTICRIPSSGSDGICLNVSNAAALAMYIARIR